MRLRTAVLAAVLAIPAGGAPDLSAQDGADDVGLFLIGLEQVVLRSDLAAYTALMDEGADRDRAVAFVDSEMIPGMTRAVIQERDRLALPGTVPGDGFSVAVDVFQEYGDRARISTWWLELKRGAEPGSTAGWQIANQGRLSSVEDLYRLSLDSTRQFTADNLEFRDADLTLTLDGGAVFVSEIDQGTTALLLLGDGEMLFHPTPETEQSQVRIFSGGEALETSFDAVYLRINPGDFDRLVSSQQLVDVPFDASQFETADRIFREDSPKSFSLELGDLSRDTWSLVPPPRDFVAEIHTRRFDVLSYSRSSSAREDISLFERRRRRTIALYSSPLNDIGTPVPGESGGADFEVEHYDVDVSVTPNRQWLEGRTRMTIRAGANALTSLTLRLAEPLVVQSVVSDEYGRLFNMRVRDQNSLVVSLPAPLLRGSSLALTITYAGRLPPQPLDAEAIAVGQFEPPLQPDSTSPFDQPEPSFLFSGQVNWYPRPAAGHYATATLRVTVPAGLDCVGSGEPDPDSPIELRAAGSQPARKTFVFHARQPLRYLAFVISRLSPARSVPVTFPPRSTEPGARPLGNLHDVLQLTVTANPGHGGRGRDVAERAADITRFYRSLVDDSPYPNLTVALVENPLPGGHSPGYFAVLNVPPRSTAFYPPRNDPASFDRVPDFVLAHELAHQWWGQAVGWRSYHEQWLSEGIAQYFAALYAEQQRGAGVFSDVMRQMRRWAANETDEGPISLGARLGHIQGDSRIFRALVYNKSAVVLHMLRQLVGDGPFFQGLRRFYRSSRFRNVGTADFRAAMETEADRSLVRFFDRWIYGSTLPSLTFSSTVEGSDVVLEFEQLGDIFDLPVTVTLQYAGQPSADVVVPVTDRLVRLRIPLAGPLRSASISRDDAPLADIVDSR